MAAQVRTVWPTFIDDMGKPRKFVVVYSPDRYTPSWGSLHRPGVDHYTSREAAQAHADTVNGVAAQEYRDRRFW
jgi:hypothetical protein